MQTESAQFELDRFEQVRAGGELVLLRVAGCWRAGAAARLAPAELEIRCGERAHRCATLPGPDDGVPVAGPNCQVWRGAFLAPADVVAAPEATFSLSAGPGTASALTAPEVRQLAAAAASPVAAAATTLDLDALRAECRRRIEAERVTASRERALKQVGARLRAANVARRTAEQRIEAADERIRSLQATLAQREEELAALVARVTDAELEGDGVQVARAELERQLVQSELERVEEEGRTAAARAEADAVRTELAAARADAEAARTELAATRADAEKAERDLAAAQEEAKSARSELERTRSVLAAARADLERTAAELATARSATETARSDAESARSEAEAARGDLSKARSDLERAAAELAAARNETQRLGDHRHEVERSKRTAQRALAERQRLEQELEQLRGEISATDRRPGARIPDDEIRVIDRRPESSPRFRRRGEAVADPRREKAPARSTVVEDITEEADTEPAVRVIRGPSRQRRTRPTAQPTAASGVRDESAPLPARTREATAPLAARTSARPARREPLGSAVVIAGVSIGVLIAIAVLLTLL